VSKSFEHWVEECATLTKPAKIVWCDGSLQEYETLVKGMLKDGTFIGLNENTFPRSYLHRSDPNDVARTENLTFICTRKEEDAGPTNNWMDPEAAKAKLRPLFDGAMRGRTMFVVPYILGPADSPGSRLGVEITDSPYVVANMRKLSRLGPKAIERLRGGEEYVPGLHSLGDLDPNRRFIMHFPEERLIWSVGSGYGGNALLGKKCFALRIASWMAREQGWMAEHMLILGLEDPTGKVTYMCAAFPSACGKTNLAMMVSSLEDQGYRVWTVGDDIAWLRIGADGRLRAINPEAGFFGVAPGTSAKTNPHVMSSMHHDAIYTNVALTPEREPWWEGINIPPPAGMLNWRGQVWNPETGTAAHPNARYTIAASQAPSISKHWEDPEGVPISAIVFGGRRARLAPLVYESRNWQHGVYVGASMASETTAAMSGQVGVTRRDPMAMLPFCGYNMGDYFGHWLEMGQRAARPPKIFHVNWFRRGDDGKFLWPGYGENVRVLKWILDRAEGRAEAVETAIGLVPGPDSLPLQGLPLSAKNVEELLRVDAADWVPEHAAVGEFFAKFGRRLPDALWEEHEVFGHRLQQSLAVSVK
jgi:phosphoenolpyruvate carboxykinase (GTP)